jgi:FlaA1/EpsC-like NDP-sugar epimerase
MKNIKSGRIYIIGAGFAGQALAAEIRSKAIFGEVAAFLDDDPEKIGSRIGGVPVLGPIRDVEELLRMNPADEAIIAIPSADRDYLREIYDILKEAAFERIRIVPGIAQIIEGDAHLIQTRNIDPQDLLGRNPAPINLRESLSYIRGRRVLVTGAGGSVGSELCRQLILGGAERLYLFGHGENSIYQIDKELRLLRSEGIGEKTALVPIIGDLKDEAYMAWLLGRVKADIIFHTAAYKHVPMMEENPVAALENNFFGTLHLINAACQSAVDRFVLITTDKAVDPVSVYGVSKRLCEELVRQAAARTGSYIAVRFGNVLGSRGSIMPLFQRQIETGGPVTVTHPQMRRYFMTIPEACSLVLKVGGVGTNGSLYQLDMGEPVLIREIAETMIRFYGLEPGEDIRIEYIGKRPGERIDEKLWGEEEEALPTPYSQILRISRKAEDAGGEPHPRGEAGDFPLDALIHRLRPICRFDPEQAALYRDASRLRQILREAVPSLMEEDSLGEYPAGEYPA